MVETMAAIALTPSPGRAGYYLLAWTAAPVLACHVAYAKSRASRGISRGLPENARLARYFTRCLKSAEVRHG